MVCPSLKSGWVWGGGGGGEEGGEGGGRGREGEREGIIKGQNAEESEFVG